MKSKIKIFKLLCCVIIPFLTYPQNKKNSKEYITKLSKQAVANLCENKYEKSLVQAREALEQSIILDDNNLIAQNYNIIAANFDELSESNKALYYYSKGLIYAEKTNNPNLLKQIYNNLGNIYCFDKKNYSKGIDYYKKSLRFSAIAKDSVQILSTEMNITWAYFDINEFQKGFPYLKFSNKNQTKYGDDESLTILQLLNGMYYTYINDTVAAKSNFENAINQAINQNESTDLKYIYQEYSKYLFKNQQADQAYIYLTKYDSLNQKITSEEKQNKINITGINLELDEYKRELEKIETLYRDKEQLLKYEKSRNKRVIGIMVSLFVVFVILFYFFFQNTKLKQNNKLKDVQRKIQDNLINASIDGQERERIRIAAFLHDNISAMLSSAGMHLKTVHSEIENIPEEITKTAAIIDEAHDRVRDLSHELLPTLLVRFGLFYAIEDLCEKNSNSKIHYEYLSTIPTNTRYNSKFEMRVYFIISELLNNINKHSKATKAQVSINLGNHELLFHVHDNGKGFDSKKVNIEGFGLNQIRARIKNLDGDFKVNSKINYGTSVKMRIPILY
ncbi:tetratricopeptide repeat-containing sensor histidine kinase [Flavobacterium agrisoli]|uniref:histidine kinase n=1 Tax=Flavobacterium agrisoli TaxID=2793066 RepID=A0A934PLH6_9FLAO|nr:ATP-binding protein [Flavobacterium agrisoli]MBK0368975.1 two-component sensor histidine kinase [Flavobacterium agrisoli]